MRERKGRLDLGRPPVKGDRLLDAWYGRLRREKARLQIGIACVARHGGLRRREVAAGGRERRAHRTRRRRHGQVHGHGDGTCDLALDSEQIAQVAVVALRPHVGLRAWLDQLGGEPHPRAVALHAAFHDEVRTQLAGDGGHGLLRAFVGERRRARDDVQVRGGNPRQLGDHLLGHTIGEVLLIRRFAHVFERQHDKPHGVRRWRGTA